MINMDLGVTDFTDLDISKTKDVGLTLFSYIVFPDERRRIGYLAYKGVEKAGIVSDEISPGPQLYELYPELSEEEVSTRFEAFKGDVFNHITAEWASTPAQLSALAEMPGHDALHKEVQSSVHECMTAGYVLLLVNVMKEFHHESISGGASASKAVDFLLSFNNRSIKGNRTDIMRCWSEFKCVAHLGAALVHISETLGRTGSETPVDAVNKAIYWSPGLTLAIAKKFQHFGLGFAPKRSKDTVLGGDGFKAIPDSWLLPDVTFELGPLTEESLQIVEKYRAPTKTY